SESRRAESRWRNGCAAWPRNAPARSPRSAPSTSPSTATTSRFAAAARLAIRSRSSVRRPSTFRSRGRRSFSSTTSSTRAARSALRSRRSSTTDAPPAAPPRRHFISIKDVTRDDIERLLATARTFERSLEREVKKLPTLKGRLVINVFYESSTRTSSSFELAAKRLSADTMSIKSSGSSVDKGESLKDTAITLGAYDPDVIVIRHPQVGAPNLVARVTEAHVVNAGDGKHQHPTQALLDLYTMREELGRLEGLHVAIVGDVLHSRVARSLIQALSLMGAHVTLVAPPALLPRGIEAMGCETTTDIAAIAAADVVYVLRMQRE